MTSVRNLSLRETFYVVIKEFMSRKGRTSVINVTRNLIERYVLFTFVEL